MQDVPHPYTVEIAPLEKPAGQFGWAIRRRGTLVERSDRAHLTEAKAHASALAAIELMLDPAAEARRR